MKLELGLPIQMVVFEDSTIVNQLGNLPPMVIDTVIYGADFCKFKLDYAMFSSPARQAHKPSLLTGFFAGFGRAYVMQLASGCQGGY